MKEDRAPLWMKFSTKIRTFETWKLHEMDEDEDRKNENGWNSKVSRIENALGFDLQKRFETTFLKKKKKKNIWGTPWAGNFVVMIWYYAENVPINE